MPGRLGAPTSLVVTVALGTLLNPLNSSMIAIALVPVQREFEVGVATVSWLVSAFYLSAAVGQPLVGRLVDLLGGRRLFIAGLVTAGTVSLLAPLVPGFWWLVGMRVLLAIGTSAAFPAALVLIRAAAEDAPTAASRAGTRPALSRPPAGSLAVLNVAAATSAACGPVLGGFLVAFAGWEAVFLVNVPVTALGVILALRFLPRVRSAHASQRATGPGADRPVPDRPVPDRPAPGEPAPTRATADEPGAARDDSRAPRTPPDETPDETAPAGFRVAAARFLRSFDLAGLVLFTVTLTALLSFLLSLGTRPQWWLLGVVPLAGVLLHRRERATEAPFLDIRGLIANRRLSAVLGQQVGLNVVFYSVFFGMPLWLQSVRGVSADATGLLVLPIALMGVLTTPLAARTVRLQGSRATLVIGSAILVAATLLVQLLDDVTPLAVVAGLALLLGVPNGFNNLGLQTALYEASPPERMGSSGGLFQTCRYLGAMMSTSVLGVVFEQNLSTQGLHQVGWIITGLAAALLGLAIVVGGRQRG